MGLRMNVKNRLDKSDFRKKIFSCNNKIRKKFKKTFHSEIDRFLDAIFRAYKACKSIDEKCRGDKQRSYTVAFLFNALNDLVCSFHLLISGYMVSSGNLMRHFMESSAMAILLSNKDLNYFERFEQEGNKFPAHKAIDYVSKNVDKLKINPGNWHNFTEIKMFYNLSSHASALALANMFHFSSKGTVVIGADFDPAKLMPYRKEIEGRISAANCLENIIEGIEKGDV